MTLDQARELLRSELLAAAAAVVPGLDGVVTSDDGPVDPSAVFGGRPSPFCRVTVQTGDPAVAGVGADQVAAAGRVLREHGWQVGEPELEAGHHRLAAVRDGFDVAVHAWDGEWRVTLTGATPAFG